jgi:glycosyltransferase involved in cell wall biosynthesis
VPRTSPPSRILWITEEAPDRSLGGGSIRQAHLFEAVAAAFPTDLLLVGSLQDERIRQGAASITQLPKSSALWSENPLVRRGLELAITLGSPLPSAAYPVGPSRRTLARALREAGPYAVACVEHESLAPLARVLGGTPSLITFHHLLSEMVRQELTHTSGRRQRWFLQRDLEKAIALERETLQRFDRVITCSEQDAAALSRLTRTRAGHIIVIPNGVDLDAFESSPLPREPRVLFPGSLNYAPNVDGAVWFCGEVWPRVRSQLPGAELVLAGREPVPDIIRLADADGITVRPNVPSMVEWFHWARVVVVPLRIGTGTRLKALEAMAAGRAVVGTAVGLDGIGLQDGTHGRVADEPGPFADAVLTLLQRDDVAERLGATAREHVRGQFGWERIGARFVELVSELLDARPRVTASQGRLVGRDGGVRG